MLNSEILTIRVSVFMAISLDGFIARPDGDVSWLDEYEPMGEGEDGGYGDIFQAVDVMVMGRGSFEKVLEFNDWPYGSKPIIVLSRSLTEFPKELQGSVRIDNSAPEELLEKLAQKGHKHIYLDGGQVVRSFLRQGLVDDLTLTVIPVLLGDGIPLFGKLEKELQLDLLESRSWKNGFAQLKYQIIK